MSDVTSAYAPHTMQRLALAKLYLDNVFPTATHTPSHLAGPWLYIMQITIDFALLTCQFEHYTLSWDISSHIIREVTLTLLVTVLGTMWVFDDMV